MLGHLMEWFYSGVAGIRQEEGSVGFKQIRIYPEPVGDLSSAKGSYLSPYGLIETEWRKTAANFELDVTVPANTTAIVYLPAMPGKRISEGNIEIDNLPEVTMVGFEKGRAVLKVVSGKYKFKVQDYL